MYASLAGNGQKGLSYNYTTSYTKRSRIFIIIINIIIIIVIIIIT